MPKDDFKKIVLIIGGKFPVNLDIVLKSAGYDCLYSISQIDEDDIKLIEQYISNNPSPIIGTEYCPTVHDLTEEFQLKLKPGHKKFLLRLAIIAGNIRASEREKRSKAKRQICVDNQASESVKNLPKTEELKQALVRRVVKYCSSKSINIVFDDKCISKFESKSDKIKCSASCSTCNISIICHYTTYWNISNFQAHLKAHLKNSSALNRVNIHQNNAAELDNLLLDH